MLKSGYNFLVKRRNKLGGIIIKKVILGVCLIIALFFVGACCRHAPKDSPDQTRRNTTVNTNRLAGSLL
jgi:hypothetical protein